MGPSKNSIREASALDPEFLSGGGELGARMRTLDWSATSLGPVEHWPQSLRTTVSICLNSRFPIVVWWGRDLTILYNDPYTSVLGIKHPSALGRPGGEVWREVWDIVGPMLEGVMERGEATRSDDLLLLLERHGYPEECYFTFSYSPIRDESGRVAGVFTPVSETTEKVIGERRLRTLRDLAARIADAESEPQAWSIAAGVLADNPYGVPFAALYRVQDGHGTAQATAYAGITSEHRFCPTQVPLQDNDTPVARLLRQVIATGRPAELPVAQAIQFDLPRGAWGVAPREVIALPISQAGQMAPLGVLMAGVNPHKLLDEDYRTFFNLVAGQIAKGVADAQSYEQELKRADVLAEIDRAKTVFFSNASHEFRTPLTLMLGPLEEMLHRGGDSIAIAREELELVHRNGIRLLKLVNTLLDFSRIEAGRIQAVYEPSDLSGITEDIASAFRSTIERAGLKYIVDCQRLQEPAYVDRDMWEKIVLNLVSNAFKFTFAGSITLRLRVVGDWIELSVSDTGVGIPEQELARIFERFHRVESVRGRTHEGTGIGLALVQELVKLHGGFIRVESAMEKGSTFVASIPRGNAHLPADRIGAERTVSSTGVSASAYVEEASRWLPDGGAPLPARPVFAADSVQAPHVQTGGRILLADDNADMRAYIRRLLGDHYEVEAVSNGVEALAEAHQNPPDLILTDVMMPELDGFGLLKHLRAGDDTRTIPVILLSARAGEDARVEGLVAGADDYIVKPFTSRELLARVGAHLALSRLRREAAERERELRGEAEAARENVVSILESIRDGFFAFDSNWRITYVNSAGLQVLGKSREELIGGEIWRLFPEIVGTALETCYRRAMADRVHLQLENFYEPWQRWFDIRIYPGNDGGISVFFQDITERKNAEDSARKTNAALQCANADLEQFAYSATHDLQEPLRAVTAYCQLLQRRFLGGLGPEADEIIGFCVGGATRMELLINDLLAYTRASGALEAAQETVDLNVAFEAALLNLSAAIVQSGASVTRDLLPAVRIGTTHFQQILQNLIGNAIKYRSDAPPRIHVSAREQDGAWLFSVQDNGIGIDPQYHEQIFGLFKRLHSGAKYPGTGIGLAICKKLVERYGGRIWLQSEEGQGTTFFFTLPQDRF
jgi:PAS domain S-box-containing protein